MDVLQVLDQFRCLVVQYNTLHGIQRRGHVNLTGGEPFIRADMAQILDYMGAHRQELTFGILSNGSLLTRSMMEKLKESGAAFVQLSIDGDRLTHDSLRAPGDYARTFRKARELEKLGIPTHISFTANSENFHYLPHVAAKCRRYGITKLWTDRLVGIGNGEQLQTISAQLLPQYLKTLKKAQGNRLTRLLYPKTQVTANRALQFMGANGNVYSCSAGDSLITVDEFGQVMPCRRMPIVCGNALEDGLEKVYFEHPVFRQLRKHDIPAGCAGCVYQYLCRGGAKCQAYSISGNFLRADPGCPLSAKF